MIQSSETKILLTGSTGFVGNHLMPRLLQKGYTILEILKDKNSISRFPGTQKFTMSEDQQAFRSTVEAFNPDIVIHLAGYLTAEDEYRFAKKTLEANILFFCRLLDTLKNTDTDFFINTGSFSERIQVDGKASPAYFYSVTKTASRNFLDYFSRDYDFKQTTVTPYTIYGARAKRKKVFDIIMEAAFREKPIDLTCGGQVLDFIHIDDVVDFYTCLIENKDKLPEKTNFLLGTGVGHSLKDLAAKATKIIGYQPKINWCGKPYRFNDVMHAVADTSLQKKLLGWKTNISLEEGIRKYINRYRLVEDGKTNA